MPSSLAFVLRVCRVSVDSFNLPARHQLAGGRGPGRERSLNAKVYLLRCHVVTRGRQAVGAGILLSYAGLAGAFVFPLLTVCLMGIFTRVH